MNNQMTEENFRARLAATAREVLNQHSTDFRAANRWAVMDRQRKTNYEFSMETRFATLEEVAKW